jgi:hypothetical protein
MGKIIGALSGGKEPEEIFLDFESTLNEVMI